MASVAEDEYAAYYVNHFPHSLVCELLGREWTHGKNRLEHRELGYEGDDYFVRWKSVESVADMKRLWADVKPRKLHFGAIFNIPPRAMKRSSDMVPVSRELFFEIDANDYPAAGVDPSDIQSCDAAWMLGVWCRGRARDTVNQLGFKHILVAYSREEGLITVHDERACALDNNERTA